MEISELTIYSTNLERQTSFYRDLLGCSVKEETSSSISFFIGNSVLKLQQRVNATPYHIAINIPSNQIGQALHWLKERVEILKDDGEEVVAFDAWNATAMYFYDADKNIIEFIARRDLKIEAAGAFSPHMLISISEIGMPVDDIEATYRAINGISSIEVYDGNFGKFCAVGDPKGLFIIINRHQKRWFPTSDAAYSSDFILVGKPSLVFRDGDDSPVDFHSLRC